MNRRVKRDLKLFWRPISPRYIKTIAKLASVFLLFIMILFISIKYIIHPTKMKLATTTTTTTTTTTMESTTVKSFDLGCFFDKTNITLADGSIRSLNRLMTGDEVLVYSSFGQIQKSRVLTIFHHQRSSIRFLDIYTTNNQEPLRLTPSHSILTKKNNNKSSLFYYDFAYNIVIGDLMFSSKLKPVRVINIKEIILYNQTISTPLTFEGNILVNNLIASCYATYTHQFMHILTTPIRYWYQIEIFSRFNYFIVHFIDFYSKIKFE